MVGRGVGLGILYDGQAGRDRCWSIVCGRNSTLYHRSIDEVAHED